LSAPLEHTYQLRDDGLNPLPEVSADPRVCLVCGRRGVTERFTKRRCWNYVRCDVCGAVFLDPRPDEHELRTYYNQTYLVPAEWYAREAKRKAPPILSGLATKLPSRGKLLEVGCSYGYLLHAAKRDGWDVTGIELDDGAAAHGRDKLGLKVFSGTLESEFERLQPPYDAIAALHVIEHLRDPITFLKLCRGLLRDDGVLFLKTPNVASWIARQTGAYWQWFSPPAHIHLFSPFTLELALKRGGFTVEKMASQRGDAHNNLFEMACAAGRFMTSGKEGDSGASGRKTWSDKWQVNAVSAVSEVVYLPFRFIVDPWLNRKGLQPELVAIARSCRADDVGVSENSHEQ
jgi:2-polyprenyl-3-methyl-5-hydroxy-6-metoxy-1,4-benzoquinol methylase